MYQTLKLNNKNQKVKIKSFTGSATGIFLLKTSLSDHTFPNGLERIRKKRVQISIQV